MHNITDVCHKWLNIKVQRFNHKMIIREHKYGARREKQMLLSLHRSNKGPALWLSSGCKERGGGSLFWVTQASLGVFKAMGELDYKSNLSWFVTPFDVRLVTLLYIIAMALTDQQNRFQLSPPTWTGSLTFLLSSIPKTPQALNSNLLKWALH